VVRLCASPVPVHAGAEGDYETIRSTLSQAVFDGRAAVDFIIERAHARRDGDERPLVLLPIGKLTNVALALEKDPTIAGEVRVVWLGSNWPEPGEYNLDNDHGALGAVLRSGVDLEIAVVRYGEPSGTAAVTVSVAEIAAIMPGLGPRASTPVPGRSGGEFSTFGDYSVELFRAAGSPDRALFDVAAVAVVKFGGWSVLTRVPAPQFRDGTWVEGGDAAHSVAFRDSFDREAIIADFFETMRHAVRR
jgi:purine nucleosidase